MSTTPREQPDWSPCRSRSNALSIRRHLWGPFIIHSHSISSIFSWYVRWMVQSVHAILYLESPRSTLRTHLGTAKRHIQKHIGASFKLLVNFILSSDNIKLSGRNCGCRASYRLLNNKSILYSYFQPLSTLHLASKIRVSVVIMHMWESSNFSSFVGARFTQHFFTITWLKCILPSYVFRNVGP